jgi:hypothetical protein
MNGDGEYRTWFERYPDRFAQETEKLKSAGFLLRQEIFEKERRVVFTGRSKSDPERELHVTFPDSFPSAAPKIADTGTSKLLKRHHRIDTRELCLFGFNQNRWSATKSVIDALDEAEDLDLLFGTELSALVCFVLAVVAHRLFLVRKSILAHTAKKDIPTEAEQLHQALRHLILLIATTLSRTILLGTNLVSMLSVLIKQKH